MINRTRDIVNFARSAGLDVLRQYNKQSRVAVDVLAPNGVETTFSISSGNRQDIEGDRIAQQKMRRFARSNPAPELQKEDLMKPKTLTLAAAPTPTPAAQELTHAEFFRLCLWSKTAIASAASIEALALMATQFVGQPVSEATMREAMIATETAEPEHWHPLLDPHVVVARELEAIMKQLGVEPSRNFARLMATLT